ncbi:uncharacterized protein LOC121403786 [Drosophila obscura]|uniref:uncharacterized protein LOC121403786 n=1 Tax=Drosophila obscura TaxID=7282 RepID=UPI001BB1AB7A|nr:uncharacterized protein LOC121403786 [Drosophila obscura]
MADVSLSINGGPSVLLEPGKVYRIGRKEAYEFCVADESMELYHALATVYRAGVLRVNALLGKVFVNDVENGNADISHAHAIDGKVKLRFGNVEAEVQLIDPLQHHDSSGFGEALRDTSVDTTAESLVIPETEVQSANTSANTTADSFFVPETQAVVFDSSTKGGKVSLGEDFMIPETQDLLRTPPPPAVVHNEAGNSNDGDASEMGSQIRISTQDFNQFDEDALDDFDSSMVLGDAVAPLSHIFGKQIRHDADGTEFELSALNWSASNSKCTVLNSSKDRGVACMTPDLSGQNPSHDAGNCTPDLFDMMVADEGLPEKSATPTLCGLKQLIVATIETPTATPLEAEDKENQDFIVPQSKVPEENNETNQDFIATQPFPFTLVSEQKAGWQAIETLKDRSSGEETNQDFIATQPFPFSSKHKRGGLPSVDSPKDRSNWDETNEDFIATQLFPTRKNLKRLHAAESTRDHSDNEDNQDFSSQIKQAKLQETDLPDDHSYYKNTREDKENIPVKNTDTETKAQTSRDAAALDSLKYDDVMELLLEMDAGAPLPTADPNEPQIKFVQPSIIKDDEYNAKITQMESVFLDRNNKHRRRLTKLPEGARGRIVGSESPPRTTRNAYQRRFSVESPRIEPRKRPANAENSVEPHSKVRRPPWNSLVAEEDKRAVSKESTPEMLAKKRSSNSKTSTNTHLDSASSSKVKRAIEPKKEEDVKESLKR